jgi:hypothetical protein
MHRRKFLTVSAASATLIVAGESCTAMTAPAAAVPGGGFSRTLFRSWLNQEFRLIASNSLRGFRAVLTAVEDGPVHAGLDQFSVVFRGGASLPQGLVWLLHPNGTQFMLHLNGEPGNTLRRAHFCLLEAKNG